MFSNGRLKRVIAISILMVLALSTFAIAANGVYEKAVTAVLGRIKFKVDGKDVTKEIESKYGSPAFVVKEYGSRAYVPVRAIAELMGLEVKWDNETHTAEIIDVKSEKLEKELEEYKEELKKKDKEIAELKKEIEKLKKNVVEETDLKTIEKELNKEFGTYKDVDFEITLKEGKNKIDVEIIMSSKDVRQQNAWNRMSHSDRKSMIGDIVNIIYSEFTNMDIYGTVYDEYYRRDLLSFYKKKNSSAVNITYDGRSRDVYDRGVYDEDIDNIVNKEFSYKDIWDVEAFIVDARGYSLDLDIEIPYNRNWGNLGERTIISILDSISYKIYRYYDYDYITMYIIVEGELEGTYKIDLLKDEQGSIDWK